MRFALAGSLSLEDVPRALGCGADVVAVRGAACDGGRTGPRQRGEGAGAEDGRGLTGSRPRSARADPRPDCRPGVANGAGVPHDSRPRSFRPPASLCPPPPRSARQAALDLVVSPWTLGPVVLGGTALAVGWAAGTRPGCSPASAGCWPAAGCWPPAGSRSWKTVTANAWRKLIAEEQADREAELDDLDRVPPTRRRPESSQRLLRALRTIRDGLEGRGGRQTRRGRRAGEGPGGGSVRRLRRPTAAQPGAGRDRPPPRRPRPQGAAGRPASDVEGGRRNGPPPRQNRRRGARGPRRSGGRATWAACGPNWTPPWRSPAAPRPG